MNIWYLYIIDKEGKLYVGVTTDLENRMSQHGAAKPLYFEGPMPKADAIKREKALKGWRAARKN